MDPRKLMKLHKTMAGCKDRDKFITAYMEATSIRKADRPAFRAKLVKQLESMGIGKSFDPKDLVPMARAAMAGKFR